MNRAGLLRSCERLEQRAAARQRVAMSQLAALEGAHGDARAAAGRARGSLATQQPWTSVCCAALELRDARSAAEQQRLHTGIRTASENAARCARERQHWGRLVCGLRRRQQRAGVRAWPD